MRGMAVGRRRREVGPQPVDALEGGPASESLGEIMNVRDAARYVGVSPDTLRKAARLGQIPWMLVGAEWRFSRTAFAVWPLELARRSVPTNPLEGLDGANARARQV